MTEFENFEKEQKTIDLAKANIVALMGIIPIGLLYFIPFYLLWRENLSINHLKESVKHINSLSGGLSITLIVMLALIGGIAVHELIHGITWSFFTKKGFRSIKFGFLVKMLTPYCHCNEPLKVTHYITGTIMPAVILGFLPSIMAIIFGNIPLLLFGTIFTVVAMGDFMIIYLIRNEDRNSLILDHPNEGGCYVLKKK